MKQSEAKAVLVQLDCIKKINFRIPNFIYKIIFLAKFFVTI